MNNFLFKNRNTNLSHKILIVHLLFSWAFDQITWSSSVNWTCSWAENREIPCIRVGCGQKLCRKASKWTFIIFYTDDIWDNTDSTSLARDIPQSCIADQRLQSNSKNCERVSVLFWNSRKVHGRLFVWFSCVLGPHVCPWLISDPSVSSWQLYRPICHHKKSFSAARGTPLFFFNNLGSHETSFMFLKTAQAGWKRLAAEHAAAHTATVSSLRILAPTETQTSKAGGVKPWNYR